MQILYMPENGKILGTANIIDVLRESARNFICPPVLSVRSLIINKDEVYFLFFFIKLYYTFCKISIILFCRQKRM